MFEQIKIGFFRGIGFSLALLIAWGIAYAVIIFTVEGMMSDFDEGDYIEHSDDIELFAKVQSYEVNENKVTLLGSIDNQTDDSWERTSVEVEFYLGDEFVRECQEEVEASIKPNSKENFELTCKSCGEEFPKFDRVEIKINDSWIEY